MTGTPASCRPRPRKGRPRTADNAIWELDIRSLELREMFERVGSLATRLAALSGPSTGDLAARLADSAARREGLPQARVTFVPEWVRRSQERRLPTRIEGGTTA